MGLLILVEDVSGEMPLVLILTFNGNATDSMNLDWEIKSHDPTLAVRRLWINPLSGDKGAEAEMNQCPYEGFGDTSLGRDGTNRKMGETACPVESLGVENTQ